MIAPATAAAAFLASADAMDSERAHRAPADLLAERRATHAFDVAEVGLDELEKWRLGDVLEHETRRFFSVEGIRVETNFGPTPVWSQPIIVQPEVGILGFLVQRFGGVLHFLAQAKMEPGNRAMVQFSPTVQATPSNYTRVHGGRSTPYLEHFVGSNRGRVLLDSLQSEQGSRYLRKRNRNIIVEASPSESIEVGDDFAWLTLGQLRRCLATGNQVNMNARTVLACISYRGAKLTAAPSGSREPFRQAVLESHAAQTDRDALLAARGWLSDRKTDMRLDVRRVALGSLPGWHIDRHAIRHESGRFFRVLGTQVSASSRETQRWCQPMVAPTQEGHVVFVCQRRAGVLQFLVQARVEPGFIDSVELGATLQFSPKNYLDPSDLPPFAELLACDDDWIRLRTVQSEDGGRFYHDEKDHRVIELPPEERLELPEHFRWMSIGTLKRLMDGGYHVTVEARSLLSCLS